MKLKNKLIPLLTVAATATTIAPLATSCTKSSEIKMIDIMNGYTPTIARAKAQSGLTKEAILDIYIDAVKKNPEIMTQDLAWYEAQALPVRLYEMKSSLIGEGKYESLEETYGLRVDSIDEITVTPKDLQFGIENPTFKEVTIVNPETSKEEKHMLVSMDMAYHFDYDLVANGTNITTLQNQTLYRHYVNHLKVSYKNVPITISYGNMGGGDSGIPFQFTGLWNIETNAWKTANQWMLNKIEDWDYKFDRQCVAVDTLTDYENNKSVFTYDESASGDINTVARLIAYEETARPEDLLNATFDFGSYYLYDLAEHKVNPLPEVLNGEIMDGNAADKYFGLAKKMHFYTTSSNDVEDYKLYLEGLSYDAYDDGDNEISPSKKGKLKLAEDLTFKIYQANGFYLGGGTPPLDLNKKVWLELKFKKDAPLYFSVPWIPGEQLEYDAPIPFVLEGTLALKIDSSLEEYEDQIIAMVNNWFDGFTDWSTGLLEPAGLGLSCSIPKETLFGFEFKNSYDEPKYAAFTTESEIELFRAESAAPEYPAEGDQ